MEQYYKVYCHTCPNNKKYIGITKQKVNKRWSNGYGYKSNKHFFNAILKYGWDNIKHDILFDNLTLEEAEEKEIELISLYNTTNEKFGYNLESGGKCFEMTQQHKDKISSANKYKRIINETGNKYNMLTAIRFLEVRNKRTYWEFVCDCGNKHIACISDVKKGHTSSCGCFFKENSKQVIKRTIKKRFPNGENPFRKELRKVKNGIVYRCKHSKKINICSSWADKDCGLDNFYNWALENGYKKGLMIIRKDNNGDFEPNNCYWGTRKDFKINLERNKQNEKNLC